MVAFITKVTIHNGYFGTKASMVAIGTTDLLIITLILVTKLPMFICLHLLSYLYDPG